MINDADGNALDGNYHFRIASNQVILQTGSELRLFATTCLEETDARCEWIARVMETGKHISKELGYRSV